MLRRHFAHPGVTAVGGLWEISSQVFFTRLLRFTALHNVLNKPRTITSYLKRSLKYPLMIALKLSVPLPYPYTFIVPLPTPNLSLLKTGNVLRMRSRSLAQSHCRTDLRRQLSATRPGDFWMTLQSVWAMCLHFTDVTPTLDLWNFKTHNLCAVLFIIYYRTKKRSVMACSINVRLFKDDGCPFPVTFRNHMFTLVPRTADVTAYNSVCINFA